LIVAALLITGWLVVSPAATIAVAVAGVVVIVGVASVASGSKSGQESQLLETTEPRLSGDRKHHLPPVWTAFLISFVVFSLDFGAFFIGQSALRYSFLLVPVVVLVLSTRNHHGRRALRSADVVLGFLALWGLLGAVYGKVFTHSISSSLTMVLPMSIGLLHRWSRGRPTEEQCGRMLVYLTNIGLAYVLVYLAARLGLRPLSLVAYSKEKGFLLAIAPTAAFVTRRWWVLAFEAAALLAIFLQQPAATFAVVVAAVIITNTLLSARSSAVKAAALAMLCVSLFFGFSLAFASARQSTLITKYFKTVGKDDNTPFRLVLLQKGTAEVRQHPVLGTNFSGEVGIETNFPGAARFAPAHNDFLQLAMAGGMVALGLYVFWIMTTNRAVLRHYHQLREAGAHNSARLLRVLVTGYNAFLFSSLFNPLLAGVGVAVLFFILYSSMNVLFPDPSFAQPAPSPSWSSATA
jgi:hypothetical protein